MMQPPLPTPANAPSRPSSGEEAVQAQALARLQALREAGADPIGLAHLEGLARQAQAHYGPLQARLQQGLERALLRFEQAQGRAAAGAGRPDTARATARPPQAALLAELNRLLREAGTAAPLTGAEDGVSAPVRSPAGRPEMKSVARFREGWSRLRAETRVAEALGRKPENAGPLNSHALLLRSLDLMRGLSPDYLRRFVTHVDALLWLDQAGQKPAPTKPRAKPRAARPKTTKSAAAKRPGPG